MAHEIETFADGSAAFVSARQDAWHRLGTVTDDCLTAEQVMAKAHLGGWRVRKAPLVGHELGDAGVTTFQVPDRYATVRNHPLTGKVDYLGVVGADWQPVQNEDQADMLNLLVDEAGAHFETAGSLKGGRQVFITMRLPKTIMVGGVDRVDLYIAALNGHDGTRALRTLLTPTRVVCANTQRMAMHDAVASYALRHTKNANNRIEEIRQALRLMWKTTDEFEAAAERMIGEALTTGEFERVVDRIWPETTGGKLAEKNRNERRLQLVTLLTEAETQAAIRGTRWAGYQAVTEWLDHYSVKTRDAAATRTLSGATDALKERAWELLAV